MGKTDKKIKPVKKKKKSGITAIVKSSQRTK